MERVQDILKTKFFEVPHIEDLKDLLYQSAREV